MPVRVERPQALDRASDLLGRRAGAEQVLGDRPERLACAHDVHVRRGSLAGRGRLGRSGGRHGLHDDRLGGRHGDRLDDGGRRLPHGDRRRRLAALGSGYRGLLGPGRRGLLTDLRCRRGGNRRRGRRRRDHRRLLDRSGRRRRLHGLRVDRRGLYGRRLHRRRLHRRRLHRRRLHGRRRRLGRIRRLGRRGCSRRRRVVRGGVDVRLLLGRRLVRQDRGGLLGRLSLELIEVVEDILLTRPRRRWRRSLSAGTGGPERRGEHSSDCERPSPAHHPHRAPVTHQVS